ncbi:MAG: hypothetical protein Q8P20_03990 [bacterium]|nr:hypothetical protein [bacterium]
MEQERQRVINFQNFIQRTIFLVTLKLAQRNFSEDGFKKVVKRILSSEPVFCSTLKLAQRNFSEDGFKKKIKMLFSGPFL